MRLVCISAAHTPYSGALMERSAKRVGVEIVRFKEGEPWPNDFRVGKLVHGLECVRSLPADVTHVMFVDSSDSLFLAGPEEIVEKFEALAGEHLSIVQGEKNCYPEADLAGQYPSPRTAWHFVNSGGWILRRSDAERVLSRIAANAVYCDQLCWTKAYLDEGEPYWGYVDVDENCQLFQSMYMQERSDFTLSNGRLENLKTGGRPCVLHWNGTQNHGSPYSRLGVWSTLNIASPSKLFTPEGARV